MRTIPNQLTIFDFMPPMPTKKEVIIRKSIPDSIILDFISSQTERLTNIYTVESFKLSTKTFSPFHC